MAMSITCAAFPDRGEIPRVHTGDGRDEAPPLHIEGVPHTARSLALIVDDPDAPRAEPFVHWVVYDIPPDVHDLGALVPAGAVEGTNDFGRRGWAGPKPPSGRHRYFFKLYALDTTLGDGGALTKEDLEERMDGHVIERTEIVGVYAKS